jgi:hypothetical protein
MDVSFSQVISNAEEVLVKGTLVFLTASGCVRFLCIEVYNLKKEIKKKSREVNGNKRKGKVVVVEPIDNER